MTSIRRALAIAAVAATSAAAQGTRSDYARAEQFLSWNSQELSINESVQPKWIGPNRLWYRNRGAKGYEFLILDLDTGQRRPAFDHARLAAALSDAADTSYDASKLPFREIQFINNDKSIRVGVRAKKNWTCDLTTYSCTGPDTLPYRKVTEVASPDGKWVAFERGNNLWIRSTAGGDSAQLTTDGITDWAYAVNRSPCCLTVTNARNKTELRPVILWSPDSKRIATHKFDERNVRNMYLLETKNPGPILHTYRYALPGDSVIPKYDLWVFDVASKKGTRVNRPPQEAVNTSCCWLSTDTIWKDVRWGTSSDQLYFTYGKRGFHELELVEADANSGSARTILKETSPTFIETNLNSGGIPNWRPLGASNEVIWFSERDGWAHLYLHDAKTGVLKNRITSGEWTVSDVVYVDEPGRWVYFTARGREPGRDVYFRHLYRVKLDGSGMQLLTPEDADHEIAMAPSGRFYLDTRSRPDQPAVSVVRSVAGQTVAEVQKGDVSKLMAAGWTPPMPFTVKARDGVTTLYGLLFRPTHVDTMKKYPIIDYIYPGPQVGSIGGRGFRTGFGGQARALAELGFYVVQVDAFGTPGRSKAFHDAFYGNMGDNGIPDHIATIKQLAARYKEIDLDRVGIFGHSGGGFASTDAILRYPDFFKVAVSGAGNHDNRSYDYTWGEKYQGLFKKLSDTTDNFDSQSNWRLAKNLRGKLFLMYGTLDDNVHPNATQLVIDELIKANKTFDMLVLPNRNHGFAGEAYPIRRTWDYFVKNLLGVEPPDGFEIKQPPAP
jgi:dipeptidyl aminopeptidase/acylaminoacyl peptidase